MTLLDIFPSLRSVMSARLDPAVWPSETHYDATGRVAVGGVALQDIADQYGTPVRVLDEMDVRHRCASYRRSFPEAEIVCAGDELVAPSVTRWVSEQRVSIITGSAVELTGVESVGVDPRRIIMHSKASAARLRALELGVGRIVVGSNDDIAHLAAHAHRPQSVLLQPPATNDAAAEQTVSEILRHPRLTPVGLLGSIRPESSDTGYTKTVARLVGQMAQARTDHGILLTELALCAESDTTVDAAAAIENALDDACAMFRFPRPRITLQPGRTTVARAMVSVHRVRSVDRHDDGRTVVAVDGSLANAKYAVLANRHSPGPFMSATIVPNDSDGTTELVQLPADLHPGEVLAAPRAARIAEGSVVAVRDGRTTELIRR